jgi:hypothetical protein
MLRLASNALQDFDPDSSTWAGLRHQQSNDRR